MTIAAGPWCPCGNHRTDPRNGRSTCPVCLDHARLAAVARALALGWRVYGTGGRA